MNTHTMAQSAELALQTGQNAEVKRKAEGITRLKHYIANAGWLFAGKMFRMGFSMIVGVWVARYLGVTQYGILSYGIAFAMLFRPVAMFQLEGICVREIVKSTQNAEVILGSAFVLTLITGFVSYAVVITAMMILRPGEPIYLAIVAIVGSGLVFFSLEVFDYWFQAQVKSKTAVISRTLVIVLIALSKIAGIVNHASLVYFAWINLAEIIFMGFAMAAAFNRSGIPLVKLRVNLSWMKLLIKDSWPLALSGVAATIYLRIDTIMIGEMLGPHDVGIYSAAVKLCEAWYFLPISIMTSLYPMVIRAIGKNPSDSDKKMQQIYNLMALLGYMAAVATTLLATPIVTLLFGPEYKQAADVLMINIWSAMFINIAMAKASWLKAMNYTKIHFAATVAGALVNVALNVVLIRKYGVIGAAWATIISYSIESYLFLFVFKKTRKQGMMISKALVFPVLKISQLR